MKTGSRFERHAGATILGFLCFLIICAAIALEFILRATMGLGNPVLYDSNPLYGNRPLPNQRLTRFHGSEITINNLGLRADVDWDGNRERKILFLGDSVTYGGSYVSNSELFSTLVGTGLPGYLSGNGAVNGWGVENVHALVVGTGFTPAEIYVSIFPEGDFYRGLARFPRLSYFAQKPTFALEELIFFSIQRLRRRGFFRSSEAAPKQNVEAVVERAVLRLKEMDTYLRSRGMKHLVFITPNREQVFRGQPKDSLVERTLGKHGIEAMYILDKLKGPELGQDSEVFHDGIHLGKQGHRIWANVIGEKLRKILGDGNDR